jgi:hypothetical protein
MVPGGQGWLRLDGTEAGAQQRIEKPRKKDQPSKENNLKAG